MRSKTEHTAFTLPGIPPHLLVLPSNTCNLSDQLNSFQNLRNFAPKIVEKAANYAKTGQKLSGEDNRPPIGQGRIIDGVLPVQGGDAPNITRN